jgi:glycerol-3-phosphate dehydrogenase
VFGGKITTYRKLAEHALGRLKPRFAHMGAAWTHATPLPGGDMPEGDFERFAREQQQHWPWLPDDLVQRYARAYGTRMHRMLDGAHGTNDLGVHLGDCLYGREVEYLVGTEWAMTAADVLWRRSKLGLHVSSETVAALERWFGSALAGQRVGFR